MSRNGSKREVACTLTEEQKAERSAEVESRLVDSYRGYEEDEGCVAIRFGGTDETLQTVAQFTSNELLCCSFADYEITVSPPYEETILTVTGPEGTRQMFREGLIEQLEAEAT